MMDSRSSIAAVLFLACVFIDAVEAQDSRPTSAPVPSVAIKTTKVAEGIYMLEGRGGNIGVSTGTDGVFMIDDQFAPLSASIAAAIAELSPAAIRFLVNTHHHGDHTGGNENFGKHGAVIVAHENVRKNMSAQQLERSMRDGSPGKLNEAALPIVTFTDSVTFHWNGEEIRVIHMDPAHTDGDSIIHFTKANVVHTGDLFFNGFYPVIDAGHGGHINGMIKVSEKLLAMTNEETKIIPGHGPLATRKDLQAFHDMLVAVRDRIAELVAENTSLADIVAARPTASFDESWGKGPRTGAQFTQLVAQMLGAK